MQEYIQRVIDNHSFTIDGTLFCSWDSVYDTIRDDLPKLTHAEICELMEKYQ